MINYTAQYMHAFDHLLLVMVAINHYIYVTTIATYETYVVLRSIFSRHTNSLQPHF